MSEISAVAISAELGIAASGGADGAVLLHTVHNGALLRVLAHPDAAPVGHLHIAGTSGRLVLGASSAGDPHVHVYALGGQRLTTLEVPGGCTAARSMRIFCSFVAEDISAAHALCSSATSS